MKLAAGILAALLVLQVAPSSGTITVTVTKAGTTLQQPLQNARLELTGGRAGDRVERTDAAGRFTFSNLAPGQYRLAVNCDGFIRQEQQKITVGSGQALSIGVELNAAPTVAGQVSDSHGEPVANVIVEALRRTYDVRGNPRLALAASAMTDDRGQYRVFWLDPGEYFLYAASPLPDDSEAEKPVAYIPTYFPGVNVSEDAKAIRLDIGQEARADFQLRRAALWTFSGHTMDAATNKPLDASITLLPPGGDPSVSQYRAKSSLSPYPGEFSIGSVAPGSYILRAKSGSGNQEVTAFQRIEIRPVAYIPPPAPPPGYSAFVTLSAPLSVNGRFFIESRQSIDLSHASVALLSVDPDLPSPQSVLARPAGEFVLNRVVTGSYVLDLSNLPQDLYLKAARFGEDDILEKPLLLQVREEARPLQILLGSDGGHLQAAAYNKNGEVQAGAQFVLVPEASRRYRREQYRIATSGEDGVATIRGILPGNYKLFAWENLEPNAYLNSDFLRGYEDLGIPVKVSAGDNNPVSVRLISKE
jgi:uncharacterized surface anchored protein